MSGEAARHTQPAGVGSARRHTRGSGLSLRYARPLHHTDTMSFSPSVLCTAWSRLEFGWNGRAIPRRHCLCASRVASSILCDFRSCDSFDGLCIVYVYVIACVILTACPCGHGPWPSGGVDDRTRSYVILGFPHPHGHAQTSD